MPRPTPTPPPTLSVAQARAVDRLAVEELGLPSIVLMENAAINAVAAVLDYLDAEVGVEPGEARVVVLCGTGNNGGDGYAIARHLHNWGVHIHLIAVGDAGKLDGDARVNADVCRCMDLPIHVIVAEGDIDAAGDHLERADILIDALLGTGFRGGGSGVREPMASLIRLINAAEKPVIAIDVPSGMNADTGAVGDDGQTTIHAALTVTFVDRKRGYDAPAAAALIGRVVVADIGVPPELVQRAMDAA